jgi:hypothetical protein
MNRTLLACLTRQDKKITIDYVRSHILKPMSFLSAFPSHHLLRSKMSARSGSRRFIIIAQVYLVSSLARKPI